MRQPASDQPSRHAFLLTAGLGIRMRPLSLDRAKAVVPVAGVALVHRILEWLSAAGIGDVMLNLHYLPESIAGIVGDGSDLGLRVRYSWEPTLLGSAGGPRLALDLIGSNPFLLVNGDTLSDVDVNALLNAHDASGALITMAVVPNPDPAWYGGVTIDDRGAVLGFPRAGHATDSTYHFVGVQAARREAFAGIASGAYAESVGELYPRLIAERPGSVRAFVCNASFRDVGTPADYLSTCLTLARQENAPGSLVAGTHIDPSARVIDSVLWEGAVVEANAELVRCVVGSHVRVPPGARFTESVLVRAEGIQPWSDERIEHGMLIGSLTSRRTRGA